jgi:ATP-dependent helicase/nuclease subunit A
VDAAVSPVEAAAETGEGRRCGKTKGEKEKARMSANGQIIGNSFTPDQQAAIAGCGNLLVVAGAGTGKTRTLVARCLRLVADERVSLENILMVTFTDAAAAEMRARLRAELRQLQAARPADPHLAEQLALLDTARLCTLHSFCLQLAREHFHELGLDPQFSVLDEPQTRPLMRATLDALLERHYTGTDAEAQAVQALIRTVGRGGDGRIRQLVLKLHAYSQSLPNPAGWLDEQQQRFAQTEPREWRQWFREAVTAWRDEWEGRVALFADEAPAAALCLTALRQLPAQPTLAEAGVALRAVQTAAQDDANWPRGTKGTVRDPLKPFFADTEFLCGLLPDEQGNDPLQQDWEWGRHPMTALLSLTREFTAAFTRAKRELAGVDFADLEQCALQLLREPATGAPTAIARDWQARLAHVFVDEYQDINAAQDAILTALSRAGAAANRFLVGDVKQSIYRFRRANPNIFSDYARRWAEPDADGRRISLADNFRSREALLDFVNPLFAALMREAVDGVAYEPLKFGAPEKRAALSRSAGTPAQPAGPRVEFHLIARADDEDEGDAAEESRPEEKPVVDLLATEREARVVARRLRELEAGAHLVWDDAEKRFRPVRWSDMVVLLRSPAGRAEEFAREFSKAGVPLVAARDGFFSSLEVSDLLSLLKLLDNPLQDVPLLAVLRSPLVGLSLEELVAVRTAHKHGLFWTALARLHHEGRTPKAEGGTPPADAWAAMRNAAWVKADAFFRGFAAWRELVRQASLSQCLEAVLTDTHYEALLLAGVRGAERVANVRRLLDLARQFDPYQRQGLFRFLRFIEAQKEEELDLEPAPPQTTDAVRLMSIHKSKGLEFPVVALAGMGTQFNEQDQRGPLLVHERHGLCPKITPPDADQNYSSLPHWLAARGERRELRGEELRLLYVALTRARDTLLLVGTTNGKADGVKWGAAPAAPIATSGVVGAHSHLQWLLAWLPQATKETDWQDERRGTNALLRWRIYADNDPLFTESVPTPAPAAAPAAAVGDDTAALAQVTARLAWHYPFAAATREPAKRSVTALVRGQAQADEEAAPVEKSRGPGPASRVRRVARPATDKLSAAEIGTAHHTFLQHLTLARADTVPGLRAEAERLRHAGALTAAEAAALDFAALAAFWTSPAGARLRAAAGHVRREVPFTARFTPAELAALGVRPAADFAADEFIVVQGIVDLALVAEREIWLLDFKTDELTPAELDARAQHYAPQLRLYAAALERIYARPVTRRWLHFLALRQTVTVD